MGCYAQAGHTSALGQTPTEAFGSPSGAVREALCGGSQRGPCAAPRPGHVRQAAAARGGGAKALGRFRSALWGLPRPLLPGETAAQPHRLRNYPNGAFFNSMAGKKRQASDLHPPHRLTASESFQHAPVTSWSGFQSREQPPSCSP